MRQLDLRFPQPHNIEYSIHIGTGLLPRLAQLTSISTASRIAIISDSNVAPRWLPALKTSLPPDTVEIVVPAGESHKHLGTLQEIWATLSDKGFDRKALILNLGGGVIGDMGGFAASTFMRGLDFIQIPTTLLSQVDASVGGKLGVNFSGTKNLLGTFQQPNAVLIDIDTLQTLPKRELLSGFAEIVKHGLIRDVDYLQQVAALDVDALDSHQLLDIVYRSCTLKAEVVQLDEAEGGLRKILNFGHTVGHALESLSHQTDSPLLHGEAISLGMIAEAQISCSMGLISSDDITNIIALLKHLQLPTRIQAQWTREEIEHKMLSDKKNSFGQIRWTLLQSPGNAIFDQLVERQHVDAGLHKIMSS